MRREDNIRKQLKKGISPFYLDTSMYPNPFDIRYGTLAVPYSDLDQGVHGIAIMAGYYLYYDVDGNYVDETDDWEDRQWFEHQVATVILGREPWWEKNEKRR